MEAYNILECTYPDTSYNRTVIYSFNTSGGEDPTETDIFCIVWQ